MNFTMAWKVITLSAAVRGSEYLKSISFLVRIPAAVGEYRRAELRSPDPAANPYLAFALMIQIR